MIGSAFVHIAETVMPSRASSPPSPRQHWFRVRSEERVSADVKRYSVDEVTCSSLRSRRLRCKQTDQFTRQVRKFTNLA